MTAPFHFRVHGIPHNWHVVGFKGRESINKPFRFWIDVLSVDGVSIEEVLGFRATLEIATSDTARFVHGVVGACEARSRHQDGRSVLRLRLEPRLGLLRHASGWRVFHDMPVTAITSQVLLEHQVPFALRATRPGAYIPRAHRIQRGERDLDFIERILAEDGLFYWFEQPPDDVAGELLVIADTPVAYSALEGTPALRHRAAERDVVVADDRSVLALRYRAKMRTDKNITRRYDHAKPQFKLAVATAPLLDQVEVQRLTPRRGASYEHEHGVEGISALSPLDGLLPDPTGGIIEGVVETVVDTLFGSTASDRLDARRREARIADCVTTYPHVAPGVAFRVEDHSESALNREYVAMRVDHVGRAPERGESIVRSYEADLTLAPRDTPLRPKRPRTRLARGMETATVIGPPGEEIHTDSLGRVQVRFHWDIEMGALPIPPIPVVGEVVAAALEAAIPGLAGAGIPPVTAWLRVAQPWAGTSFGAHFTPRVGHEVLIGFIDGDPDKPIVVGSVHNSVNVTPWSMPHDKAKSGVITRSTPGGGGGHELTFHDRAGEEILAMRSTKTLAIAAADDASVSTGTTYQLTVGADASESVGGSFTSTCAADRVESVGGDRSVHVEKTDRARVDGDQVVEVSGRLTTEVGGLLHTAAAVGRYTAIGKDGGNQADDLLTVNGQYTVGASKPITLMSLEGITLQVGKSRIKLEADRIVLDSPELQLKTSTAMSLVHGEGPDQSSLSMNGSTVLSGKSVGLKSSQGGSITVDSTALVKAPTIKLSGGAGTSDNAKVDEDAPEADAIFEVLPDGLPPSVTQVILLIAKPSGEIVEEPCPVGGSVTMKGRKGEKFMLRGMKIGDRAISTHHVTDSQEGGE